MFEYAIVGGGISGIISISVIYSQYPTAKILWIDSDSFSGGDLRKYPEVPANTPINKLIEFIGAIYNLLGINSTFTDECEILGVNNFKLYCLSEELRKISAIIHDIKSISIETGYIKSIDYRNAVWNLESKKTYVSKKVVLAIGGVPKKLNYNIPEIPINVALNPKKLRELYLKGKKITVFGNSHSGILILKNLTDLGIENVQNIIKSPIKIPYLNNKGEAIYQESGIRGIGLNWALQNLVPKNKTNIQINTYTENLIINSDYVIYSVGLKPRHMKITNYGKPITFMDDFNDSGLLFTNLYGIGVAFPKYYTLYGDCEYEIGMWEFLNRAKDIF